MLVSRRNDELVMVTQPDHAEVAGRMAAHWGNDTFAGLEPSESVITAVALHDDGWREADAQPLFNEEEKRPLHFLEIPMEEHIPLYSRGVDRTYQRDPYAGLLVSMHWTGLYRGRWGLQEGKLQWDEKGRIYELQNEAVEREERRWIDVKAQLLDGDRRSDFEARLWHNFDMLQVFDQLSLYLCMIDLSPADAEPIPVVRTLKSIDQEPGERTIPFVPVRPFVERTELHLRPIEPGVIVVDPYPFDQPEVTFRVPATAIPDRAYENAEDVAAAVASGRRLEISCRMVRG